MNLSNSLLSVITFLPLIGALFLLFITGRDAASENLVRWIALAVSTATFLLSLVMWARFDQTQTGFQFVENYDWIGNSIGYRMGVDGTGLAAHRDGERIGCVVFCGRHRQADDQPGSGIEGLRRQSPYGSAGPTMARCRA